MGLMQSYGIYWTGAYLMACSSTALGVMVGSYVENPGTAIEFLPAIFMPQILFSCFLVPPHLLPVWLSWVCFICPLTYGVQIVVTGEFESNCIENNPNFCAMALDNSDADIDDRWLYYLILLLLFVFFRLVGLLALKAKVSKFYKREAEIRSLTKNFMFPD